MSTSMNQFNTPRRSIDADSNGDGDDTSYDSTSQLSVDYDMLQQLPSAAATGTLGGGNNRLFFLEPSMPQAQQQQQQANNTISSLNAFRAQQFGQDLASFETIKRVLFNGNGIGGGGLSSNNSAVGGQNSSLIRTSG